MPREPKFFLSEKHGLNPSLVKCLNTTCSEHTGVAIMGKIRGRNDAAAPREIPGNELCNICKKRLAQENKVFIIVISDDTKEAIAHLEMDRKVINIPIPGVIALMIEKDWNKLKQRVGI